MYAVEGRREGEGRKENMSAHARTRAVVF